MQKFEQAITKQGTPLFVYPMPHVQSVALAVMVFAGSRDEQWPKEAGAMHALEHMLFQGNKRLTTQAAIAGEIEFLGGLVNAGTSEEFTFYHRVVPDYAMGTGVKSLASQMVSPLFRPEDVAKEMNNVVQEIRMYHDMPDYFCKLQLEGSVYGAHPLSKVVIGTEEAVIGLDSDDFHRFHTAFYRPENYVFLAIGNTTLADSEATFSAHDFGVASGGKNVRAKEDGVPHGNRRVFERGIKQANVSFGAMIGHANDPDVKSLAFFRVMLSGGLAFPLYRDVRDKLGLCYKVVADITRGTDCGIFHIYIGVDPDRVVEAISRIHGVIRESAEDESLFEQARGSVLGRNSISFSNPSVILNRAVFDVLLEGAPRSPDEIQAEAYSQTFEGVQAAVERWLLDQSKYSYSYVVPMGTKI